MKKSIKQKFYVPDDCQCCDTYFYVDLDIPDAKSGTCQFELIDATKDDLEKDLTEERNRKRGFKYKLLLKNSSAKH